MSSRHPLPSSTFRVQPRRLVHLHPRQENFALSQGRTVLSSGLNGFVRPATTDGLFVHQTRMLSCYRWKFDGKEPMAVALSNVEQRSWLGYYVQSPRLHSSFQDRGSGEMAEVSERSVELRLSRSVAYGIHEDVDLTNYTQERVEFDLQLEVAADFADQEETVRKRQQFGELAEKWRKVERRRWELFFDYVARHHYQHQGDEGDAAIHRSIAIQIANSTTDPAYSDGKISFKLALDPLQEWHACVLMIPRVEEEPEYPLYDCYAFEPTQNVFDISRTRFLNEATAFTVPESHTLTAVVVNALEQAKHDLASLRLHDLDQGDRAWIMAAGIPIFVALFGRDTLTASCQAGMVSSEMIQGILPVLARLQGTKVDDWRDEQPGRMLHEAHTGPLASLGFNPRARYYGAATTSGFYPFALTELWHWTGDKALVRPFVDPALRALKWKDSWADLNGDGFTEYLTHSEQGTKNQGWKDSGDAIVYEDGKEVEPPIAMCEEQAFLYVAKLHLSELLWWLDMKDEAHRLYHEATELKKRFNESFWMEDEGFVAMGLDSKDRQIKSIGSNPGLCLACGIVDDSRVQQVAERLMREDMFTGWGVRTLSALHPAFNPFSYHRGSVWPVEHATLALGFMRYGFHEKVQQIARGMFEAAALFEFQRLPEVISGHQRDPLHPFPAMYPKTNWPQAWSSSNLIGLLQCMLGMYPYAPLHALFLDPHLPPWLPEITVSNLHVGDAVVAIRFYRENDSKSTYEVLDKQGHLHVVRQPSPWSLTAGPVERLVDVLESALPGR
jgi:glycogen debranching enzyme